MSLREASQKSGLSHSYIAALEQDKRPGTKAPISPSPESLKRLSEAYGFPYEELMIKAGYLSEEQDNDDRSPAEVLIGYLEMELSNEEIIRRMNFTVDGMTLTDEEASEFVDFVRVKRAMKRQQAVSKGEEL
jgi:transcriptional regulator with XRE-family HTH domain